MLGAGTVAGCPSNWRLRLPNFTRCHKKTSGHDLGYSFTNEDTGTEGSGVVGKVSPVPSLDAAGGYTYNPGQSVWKSPSLWQSLTELIVGIDWTDPNGRLFGTHYCGPGGGGGITGQLDAFCLQHDACYKMHGVSAKANISLTTLIGLSSGGAQGGCDRVLCSELRHYQPKNANERQGVSTMYHLFGCSYQTE